MRAHSITTPPSSGDRAAREAGARAARHEGHRASATGAHDGLHLRRVRGSTTALGRAL